MAIVDVKLIGRWAHDINLGHIRKWGFQDLYLLQANGCRVSQTEYVLAPIELVVGTVPFGKKEEGKAELVINGQLKLDLVEGRDSLNGLELCQ